jgi:5-methylcytosine-specific restriction endonuclease McrA
MMICEYLYNNLMAKKILLLSSSYEPITFINERKTISLLLREKAEPVSYWENEKLGLPKAEYLPSILRLNKWYSINRKPGSFSRKIVFSRDNWTCQFCNTKLSQHDVTIDHVVPKSKGGKTNWTNCVTACKPCNRKKGDKSLEKSGLKLLSQPKPPSVHHFGFFKSEKQEWHNDWHYYIKK